MSARVTGAALALTLAGLLAGATRARAQATAQQGTPPAYRPPAVSPYLNLFRQGSPPAVNYYGLVRPQVEFRNSITGLQQQVRTLETGPSAVGGVGAELPTTGHAVGFQNLGSYYNR